MASPRESLTRRHGTGGRATRAAEGRPKEHRMSAPSKQEIRKVVLETLFFGLMPILISIAGEFGVEATHIAIVMVVCRNCATFISPVVPATFLGVGLAGVEIKDHIKKCFFWIWGCQHYLSDIRTDPGCDQIIDIINYIVIPHKVLPLQDLRVLVLQKGIGLDGPVPSLRVLGV